MTMPATAAGIAENPFEVIARYARSVPLLSAVEERALARAYERGDLRAKERMISANLRLVIKSARPYEHLSSLTLAELVNEGIVGLIRAVEKFDWRRGLKFSTYAVPWIQQSVQRAVADRGAEIRIPIHVGQRQLKVAKARKALTAELGREPTNAETAQRTGLSVADIAALDELSHVACSLDAPVHGESEELPFAGVLACERPGPAHEVEEADWAGRVRSLVDRLPKAQARALRRQFELPSEEAGPRIERETPQAAARHRALVARALERLAEVDEAAELRLAA